MRRTRFGRLAICFILSTGALLAPGILVGSGQTHSEATTGPSKTYIPLAVRNFDSAYVHPVFGVQMYGDTRSGSKYHQSLLDSKTSWIRVPIHWDRVEPVDVDPLEYEWTSSDIAFGAARSDMGGFQLIATIETAPSWAATFPDGPIHVDKLPEFAEFVGAAVERYDGDGFQDAPGSPRIDNWEAYNEPDSGTQGGEIRWGDDGDAYAQMLATIYGPVKAANPKARVVLGGIAYDWFEDQDGPFVRSFLDDVLAAGGGDYFDVMNFHNYPAFNFNWGATGPGLLEKSLAIRSKLAAYGHEDKPMVVTEAGWYRSDDATPNIQSSYVVEMFTQSLASNVEVMIWWMLYDPGAHFPDYGLVTNDAVPVAVPAMGAFQTAVDQLGGAIFKRQLTTAETGASDMEAFVFEDPENHRNLIVAWLDPIDTGKSETLQLAAPQATVFDMYGASHLVTDGADGKNDGKIKVTVNREPVYIAIAR